MRNEDGLVTLCQTTGHRHSDDTEGRERRKTERKEGRIEGRYPE